jgi:hypothetical protein
MPYTQADVDALKAQIKSGVSRIRHGDSEVEYLTIPQAISLLALMEQEVSQSVSVPRVTFAYHSGD